MRLFTMSLSVLDLLDRGYEGVACTVATDSFPETVHGYSQGLVLLYYSFSCKWPF